MIQVINQLYFAIRLCVAVDVSTIVAVRCTGSPAAPSDKEDLYRRLIRYKSSLSDGATLKKTTIR